MPYIGEAAALCTALLWTLGSYAHAVLGKRLGALRLNLVRLPLATAMLAMSCLVAGGWSALSPEAVAWLAASGVVGLALGDSFLYSCFALVGARIGVLLFSMAPAMTAFLGYVFLGETMGAQALFGIVLVTSGVCMVALERLPEGGASVDRVPLRGVVYGLLAALSQSAGLILAKQGLSLDTSPLFATLVRMGAAMVVFYLTVALGRRLHNPLAIVRSGPGVFKLAVAGAVCGPFVGVWLSLVAVKHTATGIAATLIAAILGALTAFAGTGLLFLR